MDVGAVVDQLIQLAQNTAGSSSFRYVMATGFGFLLAILAEQVNLLVERNRVRRAIREGLAFEVIENLITLDEYFDAMTLAAHSHSQHWPLAHLQTNFLQRCIDPGVASILNNSESGQAAIALTQCDLIVSELVRNKNDMILGRETSESAGRKILFHLPSIAQTHLNLLCEVIENQGVFQDSRSHEVALKMAPLFSMNALNADRIWRTSSCKAEYDPGHYFIAWRNDNPENIVKTTIVIEMWPGEGQFRIDDRRSITHRLNVLNNYRRKRILKAIQQRASASS